MPDLDFRVEGVEAVPYAAIPMLGFQVVIDNAGGEPVFSVALRCQIQIEAPRRTYSQTDKRRLLDLFGEPERWGQTLRNLLWTNVSATASHFTGGTVVEMQVPCTFDFNVAATKYFHALEAGEIPLCFLFSGTVFYDGGDGAPRVGPISWSKEAHWRLPVAIWREMMDSYYPNNAWLCLRRDVFERLYRYKVENGIPTWETALECILDRADCEVKP